MANLAIVLAQAGKSVLVVDADLRRPTQHEIFKLSPGTGLTNLLLRETGTLNPAALLRETDVPGLLVLPSGPLPPNPTELLSSARMAEVARALSREADVVLFDTPPVLAVSDPIIVGTWVDGVILVVGAGSTRVDTLSRAAQSLNQPGIRVLGAVLNRVRPHADSYYNHYYYHQHTPKDGNNHRSDSYAALTRLLR